MTRFTDEVLLQHDNSRRKDEAYATAAEVHEMATELLELRSLLATPLPAGFVAPHVVVMRGHGAEDMVSVPWRDAPLFHDEALAIGAALIRAGLQARGESE